MSETQLCSDSFIEGKKEEGQTRNKLDQLYGSRAKQSLQHSQLDLSLSHHLVINPVRYQCSMIKISHKSRSSFYISAVEFV
jgi:hypothetical protein